VGARDDAPPELLFCPRPAVLAVTAFASTFAFAALVFAVAALVVGFETSWAKAIPDHATDPNNMAAKPASVRARVNLIVSICCSPMF
jgi:hypothetical protein